MRTRDPRAYPFSVAAFVASIFGLLFLRRTRAQLDELRRLHRPFSARVPNQLPVRELLPVRDSSTIGPDDTFDVLGFRSGKILIGNVSNGQVLASKDVVIEMPAGTTDVVASMKGFTVAFGETLADNETITLVDHHLGVQVAEVGVHEVGQNSVTLRAVMLLRDINGDDRWTGWIIAQVIFLARRSSTPSSTANG
jgi:hypothetical protein